ncbi:MAG: triose-phosphate isomerase [Patescibacteria group bacterium]
MSKTFIVGNWKMNPETEHKALELFTMVAKGVENLQKIEVAICPPFVHLPNLPHGRYKISIGAQDCFWETKGAFTGEVSPSMLKSLGCSYVILGHSERKNYLGETIEMINKKLHAVLEASLTPIVCVGEKERSSENNQRQLQKQLEALLKGMESSQEVRKIVLTYEPEWAISTTEGAEPASPQRIRQSLFSIRAVLDTMFGKGTGENIRILYGGSVNRKNIKEFIEEGKAQGALVGSASLDAKEFISLVKNARVG